MRLIGPFNSGAAAGANGVATANQDSPGPVFGELVAVAVKYNDSPPAATTDVIIKTKGGSTANKYPPTQAILTLTDGATDGWFYPTDEVVSQAGAAVTGVQSRLALADFINVKIDQANAGDNVDVWLLVEG